MAGLALANVVVPIGILWLAARRRPWTVRLLMALPVAAAVPLTLFQTIEPLVPVQIGSQPVSSTVVFALASVAGIPMVALPARAGWLLLRGRWKVLARLAGWTIAASAIIAVAWVWSGSRAMPAIERYDRSNWNLIVIQGAYVIGLLMPVAWAFGWTTRRIRLRASRPTGRPIDPVPLQPTM